MISPTFSSNTASSCSGVKAAGAGCMPGLGPAGPPAPGGGKGGPPVGGPCIVSLSVHPDQREMCQRFVVKYPRLRLRLAQDLRCLRLMIDHLLASTTMEGRCRCGSVVTGPEESIFWKKDSSCRIRFDLMNASSRHNQSKGLHFYAVVLVVPSTACSNYLEPYASESKKAHRPLSSVLYWWLPIVL